MYDVAYAQTAPGAGGAGGFSMLVPLLLMFAVFYFLLIRPQQKKQRQHQDMLRSLKIGDRVITSGGLIGTIVEGGEKAIKLEVADRVRVEIGRSFITGKIVTKDAALPSAEDQAGGAGSGIGGFLGKLFGK
jgi:preprotein translocase subunit YajC